MFLFAGLQHLKRCANAFDDDGGAPLELRIKPALEAWNHSTLQ